MVRAVSTVQCAFGRKMTESGNGVWKGVWLGGFLHVKSDDTTPLSSCIKRVGIKI